MHPYAWDVPVDERGNRLWIRLMLLHRIGGGATRLHPGDFPGKRSVYPIHLLKASTRAPMARLDEVCETIAHHRPGRAG